MVGEVVFVMKKNKKNKKVVYDNQSQLKGLITHVYNAILKLDSETLSQFSFEIYKELISREDYNELDDILVKYHLLQDELIRRGCDIHV